MKTVDFDYELPAELIAQVPAEPRDSSRLMIIERHTGTTKHLTFREITQVLRSGDVLVMNNSRVMPARLLGKKMTTGGSVEIFLLRRLSNERSWEALVKPAKSLPVGAKILLGNANVNTIAEIVAVRPDGLREVSFLDEKVLFELGIIPLPPYIHTPLGNVERYQTVYSCHTGSVAAPTAGLHYTKELLHEIRQIGVETLETTLHIGLDTFRPVMVEDPRKHHIHCEYGVISQDVASKISRAKMEGRRIICVGTTAVRVLEHVAAKSLNAPLEAFEGWVDSFILPGYKFRIVDAMQTNFHLPKSSLFMMICAFAGTELTKRTYLEAKSLEYRFYSFGDAMLIL
ncbi:MAG: tRNA preQ1(34) S-adenosylmethionine ribosyltransferase-isomerase QueA [Dehalococcoidia bacterium]|nr:tRNA preQ1(34) S-adenosylmethionine ribosyltransferase-isomerase QueA [Dehalococcoidia bacterium]